MPGLAGATARREGDGCNRAIVLGDIKCPTAINRRMRVHQVPDYSAGKTQGIAVVAQLHEAEVFGLGVFGACKEAIVWAFNLVSKRRRPPLFPIATVGSKSRPLHTSRDPGLCPTCHTTGLCTPDTSLTQRA